MLNVNHFRAALVFSTALLSPPVVPAQGALDQIEFFEKRVRPILIDHCYPCHSRESKKVKGGLLLDTREGLRKGGDSGPAIIPGDADHSRLIEAIRRTNDDLKMPPKEPLTVAQIADLVAWINMGAPDPRDAPVQGSKLNVQSSEHWAFQPIREPPLPIVRNNRRVQTPIDAFIVARLEKQQLNLAPRADKLTLIRRATYDLTGLLPTPRDVDHFLNDNSPEAFAKVVDRLLASPRYGERWARHWLDVARYADTKGYVYGDREEPRFVHSAAYRDWVIRSFNEDMPYDRFLMLQLAADQLVGANLPSGSALGETNDLAAMGFLTLGRRFLGVVHDIIDDRIDVVMRGTQALTVGCARCHDHKYDSIPTKDYYSLYGVFAGCTERIVPLETQVDSANSTAYEKGLRDRVEKYEQTLKKKREELSNRFRAKTAEYLVAVLDVKRLPTEEFYEIRGPDDLNPTVVRSWETFLLATSKSSHPVFGPWHELAALPAKDFSNAAPVVLKRIAMMTNSPSTLNPHVRRVLAEHPLTSMRNVAERIGQLLAGVHLQWQSLFQVALTNKTELPTRLPDPADEQLREVLYGPHAPVNIPQLAAADLEWYFDESARVEFMKLHAEIERWMIKSTGAPPHAVVLDDKPTQKNPRVFLRGNPANQGEEVPRQFLAALSGPKREPFQAGSGRLEMARAIANRTNPLTARVMVNRVWQHHFLSGLVRTPSDFGLRSEPPTHPELLDWLAAHFMSDGWSVKKLHHLIMLSSVYQQSSEVAASAAVRVESSVPRGDSDIHIGFDTRSAASALTKHSPSLSPSDVVRGAATAISRPNPTELSPPDIDPENRLLWHFPRQRLDFEGLRDSLLHASGELDGTMGGPPVDLFRQPFSHRRAVYGFVDRQFLPGMLRVFDYANPDMHSPQRSDTTVPQQALFLMNSPFVVERSRALAKRIAADSSDDQGRIESFYRVVFQRAPTRPQLEAGLAFIRETQSLPTPEPPKPAAPVWFYGFGEFDEVSKRLKNFEMIPHFTGQAWQGGAQWPDAKLGWVQLTAEGGHAGNDLQHAVIRRWVAPLDGIVSMQGNIRHEHKEGDGIRARILSSRHGLLGDWTLHNDKSDAKIETLEVKAGDTLDFVVDRHANLNNDDFKWAPVISLTPGAARPAEGTGGYREWNAKRDFSGPPTPPPPPLEPWEKYAQVLLLSNEFMFVD